MDTGQKYYKYGVNGQEYVEARPNVGGATPSGQTEIDYNTFKSEARRIGTGRLQNYLAGTIEGPGRGAANIRAAKTAFEQYGGQSTLDKLLAGGDDFEALARANNLDPKMFQQNLQSGITMVNGVPTQTSAINPMTGQVDINQKLATQGASGVGAIPGMNTQTGQIVNPTQFQQYQDAMKGVQATGVAAPQSGGEARGTVQNAMQQATAGTPQPNPVLDNLFQTDANMGNFSKMVQDFLNPQNQGKTLKEEYEGLIKEQGIQGLNTELMNMKNVIEGAEDDIRSEITKAGGFATDSQVMALTNARNKTLIKNYNNLLQTKQQAQDYVDTLIGLSKEDKAAAAERLDSQLNLSTKLFEIQQTMQKNAVSAFQNIVDTVGYQGLAQMTGGNPHYTNLVEQTLGLGQGGLQKLASLPAEKDLQFVSGTDNQSSGYFDKSTGKFTSYGGGSGGKSSKPLQLAQTEQSITDVQSIIDNPYIRSAVGPTWLGRYVGRGLDTATGERQNYIASVEKLRSQLSLDSLINAKAKGATFGALSDTEMRILSASASKLGTWAIADDTGKVSGYSANEKDFKKELNTINNFAKLDYILKGGDPASVGVQVMPDGSLVAQNSDGTYTQLQQ